MFNNEIEVTQESPFKYDKLNRQGEVEKLTRLFEVVGNQMVLAIDSPWGTGKSTFLNMWSCYLRNERYKIIFFNVWQNDYIEEPFIGFVSSIREELVEQSKKKAFTERAQKVGAMLIKQSPKIFAKAVEKHTGVNVSEDIEGVETFIGKQIDNYTENKNSLDSFKEELAKQVKEEYEKTGKPTVIIIDELDRCRPDYAISLLERVKHIFNVPNIIFILGIDKMALSNSIKVIYGNGTDINGYLARFIDMEYNLSVASMSGYIDYLLDRYEYSKVFEKLSRNGKTMSYREFCEIIKEVIVNLNVSLRDAEKILANMYITLATNSMPLHLLYSFVLLTCMRKIDTFMYNQVKERKVTTEDIIDRFDREAKFSRWCNEIYGKGIMLKGQLLWLLNDKSAIKSLEEVCSNTAIGATDAQKMLLRKFEWNRDVEPNGFDTLNPVQTLERLTRQIEVYEQLSTM